MGGKSFEIWECEMILQAEKRKIKTKSQKLLKKVQKKLK